MTTPSELADYYAARADEYEQVYARPERQRDLSELRAAVATFSEGRRVLEIACGTGYWTAVMAPRAASVLGIDVGEEVLNVARAKRLRGVTFCTSDAFALSRVPGEFDAAFAGFWWSHIQRDDLSRFLLGLHQRIGIGAHVMFLDNRYVPGSNTAIARTDPAGNTYQRRRLSSGDEYDVLKNFPAGTEVVDALSASGAISIQLCELEYYWCATYGIGAPPDEEL